MDVQKARQVLWLQNYPRPMGELFDQGFLDRDRLEWAVQNASEPQQREAAAQFLHVLPSAGVSRKPGGVAPAKPQDAWQFPLKLGLQKARAIAWPFSPYRGQAMGPLVATKKLSLKDLGYAIENAWDTVVREAAIGLLLERLEQLLKEPPPDAGLVRVTTRGRSYAEREQLRLTFVQGAFFGLVAGLMLLLLFALVVARMIPRGPAPTLAQFIARPGGLVALLIAAGITVLVGWMALQIPTWVDNRLEHRISLFRLGQEGEERALSVMLQALDGKWTVFRDLRVPGFRGDLDFVLVGPIGIWVLEAKNLQGHYRNIGDAWQRKQREKWITAEANPSRQARVNAGHLGEFLKADGINVFVHSAVVWTNPESPLSVENPSVAVWSLERLPDELGNLWQGKKLAAGDKEKIIQKLTKLCERERAAGLSK